MANPLGGSTFGQSNHDPAARLLISQTIKPPFIWDALQTGLAPIHAIGKRILYRAQAKCRGKLLAKIIQVKLSRWGIMQALDDFVDTITDHLSGLRDSKHPIIQPVVKLALSTEPIFYTRPFTKRLSALVLLFVGTLNLMDNARHFLPGLSTCSSALVPTIVVNKNH